MAKQVAAKAVETTIEWVSLSEAWHRDPGYTINWLFHQTVFVSIVSFLAAFFFKVWWDILRANSRETVKNMMLSQFAAFTKDQTAIQSRQEERLSNLVAKLEGNVSQTRIDLIKMEHLFDKIGTRLNDIDKRLEKAERHIDANGG